MNNYDVTLLSTISTITMFDTIYFTYWEEKKKKKKKKHRSVQIHSGMYVRTFKLNISCFICHAWRSGSFFLFIY